jgi:hypothetical protein
VQHEIGRNHGLGVSLWTQVQGRIPPAMENDEHEILRPDRRQGIEAEKC